MNDEDILGMVGGAARRVAARRDIELQRIVSGAEPGVAPRRIDSNDRIASVLLGRMTSASSVTSSTGKESRSRQVSSAAEPVVSDEEVPGAPVLRLPSRKRANLAPLAAALAMAAALTVWVATSRHSTLDSANLPAYSVSLHGAAAPTRAEVEPANPGDVAHLSRDGEFQLVIRPARAVHERVEAQAFLVAHGKVQKWSVPVAVSSEGAVSIVGSTGVLFPPDITQADVVIAIGTPGLMPTSEQVERATNGDSMPGGRLYRQRVELMP